MINNKLKRQYGYDGYGVNRLKSSAIIHGLRMSLMLFAILIVSSALNTAQAQEIELLLKGGQVIDPKNKIYAIRDVAISGGKIVQVAPTIPAEKAAKVIDVKGLYVSPGFIDIHAHVF